LSEAPKPFVKTIAIRSKELHDALRSYKNQWKKRTYEQVIAELVSRAAATH
jgi:hypothetical protein